MAELTLRVKAEYESAVACREELRKVEQAMKKLNENSSPQEIERLTKRYAELTAKWENSMSFIGKAGAYIKEAFSGIGNTIRQSADVTKSLGTTTKSIEEAATKRLQLEENILTTLEAQKKVAETQRNNAAAGLTRNKTTLSNLEDKLSRKYNGQAEGFFDEADQKLLQQGREAVENWTKAWDDANVKVQVYDGLIEESTARQEKLTNAIEGTKNVYKGFADTVESSSHKIFLTEDVYNRYHQLSRTIEDLKRQITDIGQGDDIDIPKLNSLQEELAKNQTEFRALDEAARHTAEVLGSDLASRVENSLKHLYEMNSAVRNSQKNYEDLSASLKKAKQELAEAKTPAAITKAREEVDKLQDRLDSCSNTLSKFRAEQNDAIKDIEKLSKKLDESGGSGDDDGGGIADLAGGLTGKIAAIAGIGLGLNELKDFFSQAKEWREYFQDIESSMKVFLGSAEKGAEFTAKLKDYAYYNMFEFSDLAQASQQMISYGHNVENIIPRLDQLSNVATGTHGSLMELVDTYNRAKATGVVDARGIQSWAVKGVMIKDVLREMGEVTAGTTVTFEQLNKVLDHVTGEGGQFHNLMLEMMDNISAESGQLEDNLAAMYSEVGEKFEGVFVKWLKLQSAMAEGRNAFASDELLDFGAEKANQALDFLLQNWQKILSVIKDAVVIYGSYRTALITINAIEKAHGAWVAFKMAAIEGSTIATQKEALAKAVETAAEVSNTAATKANTIAKGQNASATMLATHAFKQLAAVVAANPYTIAAAAVAALAYATYAAYDGILTQEKAQRMLNSASEDFNDTMKEQEQKDREHIGIIQDKTASLVEQTKAYRALIAEREIFARFSKEEIANMSSDQINSLLSEDTAQKNEDRIRSQVEAAKELQKIFEGKGSAWAHSQDEEIENVVEKFKLLPEYADKLKDSIGWATNLSDWANQLVESSNKELQDYLVKEAEAGVVEGFKKGFSNPEIQASTSKLMQDYSEAIKKQNEEIEKQISDAQARIARLQSGEEKTTNATEKNSLINGLNGQIDALRQKLVEVRGDIGQTFRGTLSQQVMDAQEKVESLEHQLARATGNKRVEIETQLKDAKDDRDALQSIMKLIEAGKLDTEVVMKITRETENAQIGDEALVTIGEDYKKIDNVALDVMSRIDEAKKKYEELADKSDESTQQMIEDFGLTADSIDSDFENATTKINGDIEKLKAKIKDVKDDGERRKLQLEIDRKEQQISYINTLKENLKNLCKDPFNINLDIKALIPDWLKQLLSKYAGINFDEEIKKDESQRAQEEGNAAKSNIDAKNAAGPTTKTGSQWERERKKALRQELADINKQLKQPIEEKEYEELIKRKAQVESELKKGAQETKAILQRRQRDYDQYLKNREQQLAQEQKAENAAIEASIAAEENATVREKKERENRFRIQEQQLEEQIEAYKKANVEKEKAEWSNKKENKDKIWADTDTAKDVKANGYKNVALTEAQEKEINAIRDRYAKERSRYYKGELDKQKKSMQEFLIEYGTFEEQKLAITQKYEKLIADEQDPYKKAELMLKMQEEIQNAGANEIRQSINWDAIFLDVMDYDRKFLDTIQADLEKAIKDGIERGISVADMKVLTDKLQEVRKAISSKGGLFGSDGIMGGSWLGNIQQQRNYRKQLEEQYAVKLREAERLKAEATKAKNESIFDTKGFNDAVEKFGKDSKEANAAKAKMDASKAKADKAQTAANNGTQAAAGVLSMLGGSGGGASLAIVDAIVHGVNDNLQSANKMVQDWGIGGEDFQQRFAKFAESSQYATEAFDSLKKGDIAGVVYNVGEAFSTLGESFGWWSNSNRAEIQKANERLAREMTVNTEAINRLTKAMENQNPEEAFKSYESALNAFEANEEAARQTMLNNSLMYDHGQSLAYDFNDSLERLALLTAIAKKLELDYKGLSGTYIDDFHLKGESDFGLYQLLSLDAKTLNKLFEDDEGKALLQELSHAISEAEDKGNYNGIFQDLLDYMNTYGEDAYTELQNQFLQTVTDISFDSMFDSFVSSLMDMDKKAEDFAHDFEGYLRTAIYQSMAADQIKPLLDSWYKGFAAAIKNSNGKLTNAQINELMKSGGTYYNELTKQNEEFEGYEAIMKAAMDLREGIEQLGLYNGNSSQNQSASISAMERITTDQAEELIGRMNAGQIIWQQEKDEVTLLNVKAEQMLARTAEARDIAADSRDILAGMAIHVEEIRDGVVDTIVPRIKNIDDNLYNVRKLVEAQS